MLKYADYLYEESTYKDVKSLPKLEKLKEEWGINIDIIKDKQERLDIYNNKRKLKFDIQQSEKKEKYFKEFEEKYLGNEEMYEFETLSMFLTNNPLEGLSECLRNFNEIDDKASCVLLCSIVDVKRKKDKRNNQFAYLDLYTNNGIVEGICWASSYGKYQQLIKKGNHIAVLGERQDNKIIVKKIKTIEQWKIDKDLV